ncbi:MAG: DUF58 domain-containing protein [Planctomycetes bacterium]|nr:DUF58 domain-containing protein [Planctomycetota bacterium]
MNWITVALLLVAAALVFRLGLLVYAVYAVLGVVFGSRWLARAWAESVIASRECSRAEAEIGDRIAVVIDIRNRSALPVPWILVEDLLPRHALVHDPPNLSVQGRRVMLAGLAPYGNRRILYQLTPNRRGYYQIGPLVLETGDLFGLHRRYRVLTKPHFVLVYPKVIPIPGYDIASRRPIGEIRMAHRLFEDPTRIRGVRRYEPGDPMNRVHWRATARTGSLHSKVYEPSSVAGATLLLDFHHDGYPAAFEPFRSELAITATASLANALYEMGQQVGLITNGRDAADRIRLEGWAFDLRSRDAALRSADMLPRSERLRPVIVGTRRGPEQVRRILESLARLELTDGLRLDELIAETRTRMPRNATVIALVCGVTESSAIALGNLARQGYEVTAVISIHDPLDYARVAGILLAQGVRTRQLPDEPSIHALCRSAALRA